MKPKGQGKKKSMPESLSGKKEPATSKLPDLSGDSERKSIRNAFLFILLCGFLLYANTLNHGWVLDDYSVIKDNKMTTQGTKAIPDFFKSGLRDGNFLVEDNLYRPLTKTLFAIEWQLSPDNPAFFHWVNVLMYALLCGFLFLTLLRFMPGQLYLSFIATLIFTFHPIHTEVVANIKSADEILSLFLMLASLSAAHSYITKEKMMLLPVSALLYLMALFTKENAITYLALLPVTLYFFTNATIRQQVLATGTMAFVTVFYLYIHKNVIGMIGIDSVPVVDNSLFATESFTEQRMTAIYILGLYMKLLFVPHPLSCDYSFNTIPLVTSPVNGGFLISFLLHIGLFAYAVMNLRKKSIPAYAILFYFITISVVSNVFVLIGTNMGDRLVFFPSVGFALGIAWLIRRFAKLEEGSFSFGKLFSKPVILFVFAPAMLLFSFKTIDRNRDWKSDRTLYTADVKTVPNSAHMLYYHAGMIANADSIAVMSNDVRVNTLLTAEQELVKALTIYEPFPNVHALLGRIYKDLGQFDKAISHYERTLQLNANDPTSFNNYATCLFSVGRYRDAQINFKKAMDISPFCYNDAICNLGSVYGIMGDNFKVAGQLDSAKLNYDTAIDLFNKTIECDVNYANAYKFLGFTYQNLGDTTKAKQYFLKFEEVTAANQRAGR